MPISLTFDIEQSSINDANDRTRIELAFRRFGWEHIGGSSWRYPALGTSEHPSEDWFNHVVPALMYFRSLVEHSGMNVTSFTLDAHSEAGFRSNRNASVGNATPVGQAICLSSGLTLYSPNLGDKTEAILSETRLKKFVADCADSLN